MRSELYILIIFLLGLTLQAQVTNPGDIEGRIANKNTREYLASAVVEVPGTNIRGVTDSDGNYRLAGLAAGPYQLQVSYIGLDTQFRTITVSPGEHAKADFDLTGDVYMLSDMVVSTPREGQAKAIQDQREADHAMYVMSADSFGNIQDGNIGEVLKQMPGIMVFENSSPLGDPSSITIRGITSAAAVVMMNGNPTSTMDDAGSMTSAFSLKGFNTDNIESVEVWKSTTPAQPGNSLGGVVNFTTKSAFQQKGRRIKTDFQLNFIDKFLDVGTRPMGGLEPSRQFFPSGSIYFSDSYNLNGSHPYGIAVTATASETGRFGTRVSGGELKLPNPPYGTPASPSYPAVSNGASWQEYSALRKSQRLSLAFDQKLSESSSYYINTDYNRENQFEGGNRQFSVSINSAVIGDGTTRDAIVVPATRNSRLNQSVALQRYVTNKWQVNPGVKHKWGDFTLAYDAYYSRAKTNSNNTNVSAQLNPASSDASNRISFTVSGVQDPKGATLTPAPGSIDYTDPANWTTANIDGHLYNWGIEARYGAKVDVKRVFLFRFPLTLQAGGSTNTQFRTTYQPSQTFAFNGVDGLAQTADDPKLNQFVDQNGKGSFYFSDKVPGIPFFSPILERNYLQQHPEQFTSSFFNAATPILNYQKFGSQAVATYFMGSIRFYRFTLLGGARWERTVQSATGHIVDQTLGTSDSVTYIPNQITKETTKASKFSARRPFDFWFPSVHLKYDVTKRLQILASITRSAGLVDASQLIPSASYDPYNPPPRITLNNPDLRAQESKNYDLALDYYIPRGVMGVSFFKKDYRNYVTSVDRVIPSGIDNGFGGLYAGYTLTEKFNTGTVNAQGYEIYFREALYFLPWKLKSLSVDLNYSFAKQWTDRLSNNAWSRNSDGLVPHTANAALRYTGRIFYWQVKANWRDKYTDSTATWAGTNIIQSQNYWASRTTVDLSVQYRLSNQWSLYSDWRNLTGARQVLRFTSGLINRDDETFQNITFGLRGEF